MKKCKKRAMIVGVIFSVVMAMSLCIGIKNVNAQYNVESENICPLGKTLEYKNVELSIVNHIWMSKEELKEYHIESLSNLGEPKALIVDLKIENSGFEPQSLYLYNYLMESNYYSNALNLDLFIALNPEESMTVMLDVGERKELKLPYVIYEKQFTERQWKDIENVQGNIIVELYPQKKSLEYN